LWRWAEGSAGSGSLGPCMASDCHRSPKWLRSKRRRLGR
jgi:hypothetical protein